MKLNGIHAPQITGTPVSTSTLPLCSQVHVLGLRKPYKSHRMKSLSFPSIGRSCDDSSWVRSHRHLLGIPAPVFFFVQSSQRAFEFSKIVTQHWWTSPGMHTTKWHSWRYALISWSYLPESMPLPLLLFPPSYVEADFRRQLCGRPCTGSCGRLTEEEPSPDYRLHAAKES